MWKRFAIAAMACIIITHSIAQIIKPLSIGDTVSSEKFFSLLNDKDSLFSLSQTKDELLLLDFWATWCTSCIVKFPLLDSLQQQFAGKLKVLLMNWGEDKTKIISFLDKYAARKKSPLNLSIIIHDTVLRSLFPHYSIPHYVWIYKGRLLATTGPDMLDASRIEQVLAGQPVSFKMKRDDMDFDTKKFLLESGNGGDKERQLFRSLLTRELVGVRAGYQFIRDSTSLRGLYINFPVLTLYQLAFGFDNNRIIVEVRDPLVYLGSDPELFSYEMTVPLDVSEEKLRDFMKIDLDRYFGLKGRIEKRKVSCYVLKKINIKNSKETGTDKIKIAETENSGLPHSRPVPLKVFVRDMNTSFLGLRQKPIIVDETGYSGNISIRLSVDARDDLTRLNKALLAEGFKLEKAVRLLDMFVLKQNARDK